MLSNFRRTLYALGFLALGVSALILTVKFGLLSGSETETVTSRAILERISDHYFVVTKSAIVDEETTITVDQGSAWSNFFWGQTVEARGDVRIDIGVDLSGLEESDIIIDHEARTVSIDVPAAEILDASQYGPIEVDSKQGVLKWLTDNDPNEDHNRALEQLVAEARKQVLQDDALFEEARQDASKLLELIVSGFGYELVMPESTTAEPQTI